MTEEKIYLSGITKEALAELVASEVEQRIHSTRSTAVDEKKPLDIEGAADFTGLAKQSLYKMTSEGTVPFHKVGGKLFFFRDEILAWIKNEQPSNKRIHMR